MAQSDQATTKRNAEIESEVKALKQDMQSVMKRLESLKGHTQGELSQQMGNMMHRLNDIGAQGMSMGKEYMNSMEECIRKKPMSSVGYAFGAGILLAMLLRK